MGSLVLSRLRQSGFRRREPIDGAVVFVDAFLSSHHAAPGSRVMRDLGYVVEVGGVRPYHACDCIPSDHRVERVGGFHAQRALLPINRPDFYREGECNIMGKVDSGEAGLGAPARIPMQWEMFSRNRRFQVTLAHGWRSSIGLTMLTFGQSGVSRLRPMRRIKRP